MSCIAVITYNHPHRKTQDLIFGLKAQGYTNVNLLALPFIKRKNQFQPIYNHRPSDAYPIYPKDLANNFNYKHALVNINEISEILDKINPTATLIAGAGLLPDDLVYTHKIINSHPAYLPDVRGLDALKWAIYYKQKIGVTSHFINSKADAGYLIKQIEIPIHANDSFHSVAYRQYRKEIDLLIESVSISKIKHEFIALEEIGNVNKRMPKSIEKDLLVHFDNYKKLFALQTL